MPTLFIVLVLLSGCLKVAAQAPADYVGQIRAVAENQIAEHPSLSGREHSVRWEASPALPSCPVPSRVAVVDRARLWGLVSVTVTCPSSSPWMRTLKSRVVVPGAFWQAKESLRGGTPFELEQWEPTRGDLGLFPEPILRVLVENPDQLVGHETLRLVAKGRPLVLTDWRQIAVVKRGQRVKLVLLGAGFEVVSSGTALDEAQTGGKVRVRMPEGKVVEGVAGVDGAVTVLLN